MAGALTSHRGGWSGTSLPAQPAVKGSAHDLSKDFGSAREIQRGLYLAICRGLTGRDRRDYREPRNQCRGRLEMRGLRGLPLLSAAGAVIIAGVAQPVAAQEAEVIHWWTSGGESAAVKVFADKLPRPAAPGSIPRSLSARTRAPPASTGSSAATRQPRCSSTPASSSTSSSPTACCAISTTWPRPASGATCCRRRSSTPSPATATFYAVPVNIHGQNWLWYNAKVLRGRRPSSRRRTSSTCGARPQAEGGRRDRRSPRAASPGRSGCCSTRSCSPRPAPRSIKAVLGGKISKR